MLFYDKTLKDILKNIPLGRVWLPERENITLGFDAGVAARAKLQEKRYQARGGIL